MSNKIRVIVTDLTTGKNIMDSSMQYAPRRSDEIRIDSPRGGWYFYIVKRVVWGMGGLSSYLYLDVEPLPGRLDIGEQPTEDQPTTKKDEAAEIKDRDKYIADLESDIAFYRGCINGGKTPADGDEPSSARKRS